MMFYTKPDFDFAQFDCHPERSRRVFEKKALKQK